MAPLSWSFPSAFGCPGNPQGCQTVAGGRQTSGTVGKEHPTRKGPQTDSGGGTD
jgi:hypothetical protein